MSPAPVPVGPRYNPRAHGALLKYYGLTSAAGLHDVAGMVPAAAQWLTTPRGRGPGFFELADRYSRELPGGGALGRHRDQAAREALEAGWPESALLLADLGAVEPPAGKLGALAATPGMLARTARARRTTPAGLAAGLREDVQPVSPGTREQQTLPTKQYVRPRRTRQQSARRQDRLRRAIRRNYDRNLADARKGLEVARGGGWYDLSPLWGEVDRILGSKQGELFRLGLAARLGVTSAMTSVPVNVRRALWAQGRVQTGRPIRPGELPPTRGSGAEKIPVRRELARTEDAIGETALELEHAKRSGASGEDLDKLRQRLKGLKAERTALRSREKASGGLGGVSQKEQMKSLAEIQRLEAEGLDPLEVMSPTENPKTRRYAEAIAGNWADSIVDRHNVRSWAGKDFAAEMGDAPELEDYAIFDAANKRLAAELGLEPAAAQAALWVGAAERTGVEDARNMIEIINDVVAENAAMRGVTPDQMLEDYLLGKAEMYGIGGTLLAGMGGSLLDLELRRDDAE